MSGETTEPEPGGPAKPDTLRAFISYARADCDAALELKRQLEQSGHAVFLDTTSLRSGELWPDTLRDAIHGCNRFWLLWSKHAARSQWVRLECTEALALRRQWKLERFIQIRQLDTEPLPRELATTQVETTPKKSRSKAFYVTAAGVVLVATVARLVMSNRERPAAAETSSRPSANTLAQVPATSTSVALSADPSLPTAFTTTSSHAKPETLPRTASSVAHLPLPSQDNALAVDDGPRPAAVHPNDAQPPAPHRNITRVRERAVNQGFRSPGAVPGTVEQDVRVNSIHATDHSNVVVAVVSATPGSDIHQNPSVKNVNASGSANVSIAIVTK